MRQFQTSWRVNEREKHEVYTGQLLEKRYIRQASIAHHHLSVAALAVVVTIFVFESIVPACIKSERKWSHSGLLSMKDRVTLFSHNCMPSGGLTRIAPLTGLMFTLIRQSLVRRARFLRMPRIRAIAIVVLLLFYTIDRTGRNRHALSSA